MPLGHVQSAHGYNLDGQRCYLSNYMLRLHVITVYLMCIFSCKLALDKGLS